MHARVQLLTLEPKCFGFLLLFFFLFAFPNNENDHGRENIVFGSENDDIEWFFAWKQQENMNFGTISKLLCILSEKTEENLA